jgi:gas vesicle protein
MSKVGQENEAFTDPETIVNNLFSKQPLKRKRTPLRLKLNAEGLGTLSRQLETKIEGVTEKIAGRVEKFKDDITENARRVRFQFTERAKKAREKIEKIREKIDKFQLHHLYTKFS